MSKRKIDYNKRQAQKHGWTPEWFGCTDFDKELILSITKYQQEEGLGADGMCGPSTYRRIWTDRNTEELDTIETVNFREFIVYNNQKIPILWDKVIVSSEPGGKQASKGHYSYYRNKRDPQFFVTHWDVCLNSSSCFKVLENRGISVHFGIDNDGTIFQWLDMNHVAWHAGGRTWNHNSVGVEVSNGYYTKYQDWYVRKGFGERPLVEGATCHGKNLKPFLGFYPKQLQALAALWEAVSFACNIPLELPKTKDGVDEDCAQGTFHGFCQHYHLKRSKIDCAGMDNDLILQRALALRKQRLNKE